MMFPPHELRRLGTPVQKPSRGPIRTYVVSHTKKFANNGRNIGLTMVANIFICGLLYWSTDEGSGPIRSLWWSIVTASTVGYGDIYPTSTAGRGIAAFLIVSTIILGWIASALLLRSFLMDANEFTNDEQVEMLRLLRENNALNRAIMERCGIDMSVVGEESDTPVLAHDATTKVPTPLSYD